MDTASRRNWISRSLIILLISAAILPLTSCSKKSSAAIVAIVAGFMLSRLLALSGERNGLSMRQAQLVEELRHADAQYLSVERRLDGWDEASVDQARYREALRDRDAIYGDPFRRRVASMGIGEVISSPSSPWQNPYAERLIGSLRRECLDHILVFSEARLRRVLTFYVFYYHRARTHLAFEKDAPTTRRVQTPTEGPVVAFPEVGGLHHRYERRAA